MATPSPKPSKRLIVCCDGTWEAGDHATKRDSSYQTNITRICRALAHNAKMPDGTKIPQIIYYQSGVGSISPTVLGRTIAAAFGRGVNENILSAYSFLVNNYTPGDELFFFGFSRGSFTCRSLAGMISQFGILKKEEAGEWFPGIWERYQGTLKDPTWEENKLNLTHRVSIKVIGCWDTVGSLGIPETRNTKFFTKIFHLNRKHAFHDTKLSNEVENAFHALALDDIRMTFKPTLWYIAPEQADIAPEQAEIPPMRRTQLKQCWFAGVHTDVGRGFKDHVPGDIADITFAWMVDQCRHLLAFNEVKVSNMLDKGDFKEPVRGRAKRKRARRENKAKTWGLADLHTRRPVDLGDPMDFMHKLSGIKARTPGQYVFKAHGPACVKTGKSRSGSPGRNGFVTKSKILPKQEAKPWYARLWSTVSRVFVDSSKDISKFDPVWTSEVIHPSVRMRMMQDLAYNPFALRGFKLRYDAADSRWTWTKEWTDINGAVRETTMHEDRIEDSHFSIRKAGQEILKFRADEEDPIPPNRVREWRY